MVGSFTQGESDLPVLLFGAARAPAGPQLTARGASAERAKPWLKQF